MVGGERKRSKILVIGGTGRIGSHIVLASIAAGHPTFLLVRPSTANPAKSDLIATYRKSGATILSGDIRNHESLLWAIKQVDVVISAVGHESGDALEAQFKILEAIEEAGNIKRFIPSEFGLDVEQLHGLVEPAKSLLGVKVRLRQAVREKGVPHTFVCNFFIHGFFLPRLGQADAEAYSSSSLGGTTVFVPGDGDKRAIFVNEKDVGAYTIRAVDDPSTLNKILYVRPPENFYTLNELIALWENKTGKELKRIYVTEEQLLKKIAESPFPLNFQLAIAHSAFVKGWPINFDPDAGNGVEATRLYPNIMYLTVEDFFSELIKPSD